MKMRYKVAPRTAYRILLIAKRDYLATIRTKAFIIGLVIAPLLFGGGFLGIAEKYHPVPWSSLDYTEGQQSYVVNFTKDQLRAAPSDSLEALTKGDGRAYRDRAFDYYKIERYW